MSGVGRQIKSLEFVGQHVERAYLNEDRVHERFTASIGAISTWVAKASKGSGGKVGLFGAGLEGQLGSANEVTYNITNPVAQALLLRASVEDQEMLMKLDEAKTLEYVLVTGMSCFRHPSLPEAGWHSQAC